MERLFKAIFGAITGALMSLVSIGIPIAGIWHGIFVIPNYCRHLLYPEVLFKACDITTMYNIFWWICLVIQIPTIICIICYMVCSPIIAAFSAATDE